LPWVARLKKLLASQRRGRILRGHRRRRDGS